MGLEREAKLAAPAGFRLPDLGDGATAPATRTLDATYWDTRDLRLARDGLTLRHRTGEGADRWTLKLPAAATAGAGTARTEHDVPGPPGEVPAGLARLVRAWVRTSHLEPVGRLVTTRTAVVVGGAAEVVDDHVEVDGGEPFRELEVELLPGAPDGLLDELVERLVAAGATLGDQTPKLVRALGERAAAPAELAPVPVPDDPIVADVAAAALADAVREARAGDVLVVAGDAADGVLAVRKGLRRCRSVLGLLAPVLDREAVEPVRDAAGEVVDALTPARLAERVAVTVAEVAPALADRADADRAAAAGAAAAALDGEAWRRLLDDLVALVADPPLGPEAGAPAADVVVRLLAGTWRELAATVGAAPGDDPLTGLRRTVTAARDAADLAVPVAGDPATGLARSLSKLRRVLGDHRDALLAAEWLAAAGADAEAATARAMATEAAARWPDAWAAAAERAAWLA